MKFAVKFSRYTKASRLRDDIHLSEVGHAKGAGMDTTKACLDGTREILKNIIEWVDNPDANAPSILWLSGAAATGKSAIARDLVSHDSEPKQILANVVAGDSSLCTTEDVTQQWQKLI
ncbi:hypothetical protein M378DRAFT_818399 [Amanita muscaria Koide BX008]|uniref:Uncharacterized protein n=1 Tax=Amanita muscaria (strain Koide BX008) TaxID=946122 RepID=A0A0C2WJT7_AMAMK|nr:hypothetical protein M378DRAFT_818399 [Amanita muscaria Koide BX008]